MDRDQIIRSLRQFKKQNAKKYNILKLGFFGSAVRDYMGETSDLDIVVMLEKQDLFDLIGIKQDLEEQLDLPVDIISYRDKMNTFLKDRIDTEAIYV
ncbi:MAG: nucleotidyltransferase domain-containing protein [Deltaproteobacteria bacterium]|nr:nucleotidyltransferase domain-containing protein [Deltaproteobacteria bacterium]